MLDAGTLLAQRLRGINVYLVGMMGAGKSTVGQRLARELGYRFVDTDTIVEQVTHTTIPDIFASDGEAGFRAIETQVLEQVAAFQRTVVATGGGIVLDDRNWGHMRQGVVLWLDVAIDDLLARVSGDANRPLLNQPDPKATLVALLADRRDRYALADAQISSTNAESEDATVGTAIAALMQAIAVQNPSATN